MLHTTVDCSMLLTYSGLFYVTYIRTVDCSMWLSHCVIPCYLQTVDHSMLLHTVDCPLVKHITRTNIKLFHETFLWWNGGLFHVTCLQWIVPCLVRTIQWIVPWQTMCEESPTLNHTRSWSFTPVLQYYNMKSYRKRWNHFGRAICQRYTTQVEFLCHREFLKKKDDKCFLARGVVLGERCYFLHLSSCWNTY